MNVEMTLIGFAAEKPHSRMGFTPCSGDLAKTFAEHAAHVAADPFKKCIHPGCNQATQLGTSQGWTCAEHDPLHLKVKR